MLILILLWFYPMNPFENAMVAVLNPPRGLLPEIPAVPIGLSKLPPLDYKPKLLLLLLMILILLVSLCRLFVNWLSSLVTGLSMSLLITVRLLLV